MRNHRDDDHDIRELVRHGSSSWAGPSPFARQSRWAAEATRRRWLHSAGLVAAGFCLAVVVLGSLTLVAASQAPNGTAASVVRLVSQVFTGPPAGPPVVSPEPPVTAPSPTPSVVPPTPSRAPSAPPRATPRPAPSPTRSGDPGRPSPSPVVPPSPSPSRPPDE